MKIIDILTSPWAIVPEKLYEIQEIYSTHLRGEKIDISSIEAMVKEPGDGDGDERYQVVEGVAIIPIQGVIAKRMNLFSRISGGVSTQMVGDDIKSALADETVNGILLDIDSPGGSVDGTEDLVNIIYEGREQKAIVAYSDGMIASAAYWIASAAQAVYISGATVEVGSIGVVATHVDYSQNEEKRGVKTTEIYAGKYKRMASNYKPLSDEGRGMIQERVDYIYTVFVDSVARNRGTNSETVLSKMADGRIFTGRQAVDAGLVDGILSFDRVMEERLPVVRSRIARDKLFGQVNRNFKQQGGIDHE